MAKAGDWHDATRAILEGLDVRAEYEALGVIFASNGHVSGSGWLACHAADGRPDNNPSAAVCIARDSAALGRYRDLGGSGESLGLFDFAVRVGKFPDWLAARKHYAGIANVKLPGGNPPKHPAEALDFLPWSDLFASLWAKQKSGVTIEAMQRAGCRLAKWPKKLAQPFFVVAMPVFGPQLLDDDPCGWVLWNKSGRTLPLFQGQGKQPKPVKMLSTGGSRAGWLGQSGLREIVDAELVWLVEGPTDLLALDAIIPDDLRGRHIVLANSGGAGETPRSDLLQVLAGKRAVIIRDADEAGQAGAEKWLPKLAEICGEVKNVRLPYAIEKDHGKDLRDWLGEGNGYTDLLALADSENCEPAQTGARQMRNSCATEAKPDQTGAQPARDDLLTHERQIVRAIRLEILGEQEHGGGIEAFSEFHRKTVTIPDISRLTYPALLKICGPPAKEHVLESSSDTPPPGLYQLRDVRQAIALLAGYRRLTSQSVAGPGCWVGLDEHGHEDAASVILVGAGEAGLVNGTGRLEPRSTPKVGGRIVNLSHCDPWYATDFLSSTLEKCDHDFSAATIQETKALFSRWQWKNQAVAPALATGLVLSTWVQTLWKWRPQVAVIGASNSGKTTLFDCLEGIFGKLTEKSSRSTAAGIRQTIQTSAKILLCDEFEDSGQRRDILEMLRASGRGDKVLRGTPGQKGHEYILRHLVWVAAIEVGLKREPDRNRFVMLELIRPEEAEQGKLVLPAADILHDLGQRLLAIAIRYIGPAREMAVALKGQRFAGYDGRVIESYSVPAAMLAAAFGQGLREASEFMGSLLANVDQNTQRSYDEDDLLSAILSGIVDLGKDGRQTVGRILDKPHEFSDGYQALERDGVALCWATQAPRGTRTTLPQILFLDHKRVCNRILRGTEWERQSIDQILLRFDGATRERRRISGSLAHGVSIPIDSIADKFLGSDEAEQTEQSRNTQQEF